MGGEGDPPTFEVFQASARNALIYVDASSDILNAFDEKGPAFDFLDDGGIDSLDMLDLCFYINKDLGVHLQIQRLVDNDKSPTLENLYGLTKVEITSA